MGQRCRSDLVHATCTCHCSSEFKAERIPTLNEVLDLCEELGLCVYLEVKLGQWQVLLPALKQLYANRKGLYSWMAVISFWPTFLYKVNMASI